MELKFNLDLKKLAMIAILGLACLASSLTTRSCMNRQLSKYEHNIAAYEDTLRVYKLKDSSTVAAKRAFLVTQSELQSKLKQQGILIDDLNKKLRSKTVMASNINAAIEIPEVKPEVIHDTIYTNGDRRAHLAFRDEYINLDAYMRVHDTISLSLSNIMVPVDFTVGQTKDKQVYVTSKNPYIKVNGIESLIVPEKKKKWGIGVNVGPGVYYDPFNKCASVGVGAQLGIQFNLR